MSRAALAGGALALTLLLAALTGCEQPEAIRARAEAEAIRVEANNKAYVSPCVKIEDSRRRDACMERVQRRQVCAQIYDRYARANCYRDVALMMNAPEPEAEP